jgi:hypothetical protein
MASFQTGGHENCTIARSHASVFVGQFDCACDVFALGLIVAPPLTWGIISENNDTEFACIMATARTQSQSG